MTASPRTALGPPLLRSLSPLRWLPCLAAAGGTVLAAGALAAGLDGAPLDLSGWLARPGSTLAGAGRAIAGRSGAARFAAGGGALAAAWILWAPVGGWIARREVAVDRADPAILPRLAAGGLLGPVPGLVVAIGLVLVPGALIGLLGGLGGFGAMLLALLVPVVLLAAALAVLLAGVLLAAPLLPAALAADGDDGIGAVVTVAQYLYARPVRALLGQAGLAVPIALALARIDAPGPIVLALAALGLSAFWSIQPALYLDLRRRVDGVEPEVVGGDERAATRPTGPESGPIDAIPWRETIRLHPLGVEPRSLWLLSWAVLKIGGLLGLALVALRVAGRSTTPLLERIGGDPGPVALAALATVALATPILVSTTRAAARLLAVSIVHHHVPTTDLARRRRGPAAGPTALVAAAVVALLLAPFVGSAVAGAGLGLAALVALGLGGLGLGRVAVGPGPDRQAIESSGAVGSALVHLLGGPVSSAAFAGLLGLVWAVGIGSAGALAGERVAWLGWGLGGGPGATDQPIVRMASGLIGAQLLFLFGLALAHPVFLAIRWGVLVRLGQRSRAGGLGPDPLDLDPDEAAFLEAARTAALAARQAVVRES